ncbi:MAG: sensor histidine kinase [Bacteroidetes bacterium]|nr:sensor histidine kinase [Bacteroidota bacterium]
MLKSFLFFISLILVGLGVQSQPDTARINKYFRMSDYWSDKDSAKAVGYINDYFKEAIHDDYYDGVAHFYLAGAYFDFDLARAQQEYMKADELLKNNTTKDAILFRSRAWHNYGVLEQKKDDNKSFVDIQLNKAIPLALQAGDTSRVAWNYKEVGMVFMNFEEFAKAQHYYRTALNLLHLPTADTEVMADCYINIAKAYLLQENVPPARKPLDSAGTLLSTLPNSTYQPAKYLVEAMYHSRTGNWKQALDSLDKGVMLARQYNRSYDESSLLFEKYEIYRKEKKYVEARAILSEVAAFNQRLPLVHNKQLILHELAQTEAALGHMDSAYKWLDQYAQLSDSLSKTGTALQIADLEAKYRSSEKERELLELSNQSKIQRLLLSGGLLLLAAGLLFFLYRSRQRKLQSEQAVRSLQQQQQIEVAGALLNGEERERQRLARELHDGLGGMLAGIKINLSEIASGEGHDSPAMQKIIRQLDSSVKDLRHIAHNLMPESLVRSGLEVALKDLCETLGNGSTKVELQMMNIGDIPKQTQLIIYRIVQELLANVLKHARASEVFVQCSQSENVFYITVEDDGIGIKPSNSSNPSNPSNGIGLENIRHRVEFLKGKLEIDTTPGSGTIVNIEVHVDQR